MQMILIGFIQDERLEERILLVCCVAKSISLILKIHFFRELIDRSHRIELIIKVSAYGRYFLLKVLAMDWMMLHFLINWLLRDVWKLVSLLSHCYLVLALVLLLTTRCHSTLLRASAIKHLKAL